MNEVNWQPVAVPPATVPPYTQSLITPHDSVAPETLPQLVFGVLNMYLIAPSVKLTWAMKESPWEMNGVLIKIPAPAAQPH